MALLMLVATVWAVAQLTVLASWSRTVRFSTLLLVVAFGAYACGVAAVVVQWGWTRLFSALTHTSLSSLVDTASYTVDPVIEEVVKVLPLALVGVLLARVSRQLGFTDYLLVGAATGAGFGLFESLMRFGSVWALTTSVDDGYLVQASLGGSVVVPRIGTTLMSWLPEPTSTEAILGPATGGISHLAWTALAGAGIGWFWRRTGARRWWGVVPVAYACADHMLYNYVVISSTVSGPLAPVNAVVSWVHQRLGFFVLAGLVTAVIVDRLTLASGREAHPELLLAGERTDGLEVRPLWVFARVAPPWTALVSGRFVLSRRAALYASALDPADNRLVDLVARTRAQMDWARDPARWAQATRNVPRTPGALLATVGRLLRDWRVLVWLVVLVPALLYLVVGGFPATLVLQGVFRTSGGSWLVLACTAAGIVLLVLQLVPMIRSRAAALAVPAGETVGRYCVQIGTGAGALAAGVVLAAAALIGGR
ncbi:MAG TPA: PrsW family glutamic-type intramembrane protease, partial [Lapillicoccus sp.]|nr:PrsW family glutamic-type intramembrane protease [Lapillicoccus sp.]